MRICHSGAYGSGSTVCTVPEGLRPKRDLAFTVLTQGTGSESAPCTIFVGADGVVKARPYMSDPWWVIGAATWVI